MDVLCDFTSAVVEFKATQPFEKLITLVDNCTVTNPAVVVKDISVETCPKQNAGTQTQQSTATVAEYDERKLARWLRQIYSNIEVELQQGPTPMLDVYESQTGFSLLSVTTVQPYQKISINAIENSMGLATWLSVHTNNVPVLVATTVAPHDDWCEHINQNLILYVPKRVANGNYVVFTEVKTVQLKSCLRSLCTNPYNKNIFAGAAMDGDIYIWQYDHAALDHNIELKMLHCVTSIHGAAVAMDWPAEQRLLTCYSSGLIQQWFLGKQMILDWDYTFRTPNTTTTGAPVEVTSMISLQLNDFIVGTKIGGVYRCWNTSIALGSGIPKQFQVTALKRHSFMVSTLLKTNINGHIVVLSCDLSGQVYYHEMHNADEDTTKVIIQIPLPFKNAIACTRDGKIIYCPSSNGALECYRVSDGAHSIIKGALHGRANFIKFSDNGFWIITGLYGEDFQIFYVEC